jgi:chorismate synthase
MGRLRWTTAGESHGLSLVGVLDGLPAGLALDLARVDGELARRQAGYGRSKRQRLEEDKLELLSGTRAGLTLGSPLAFRIANKDASIERLEVPSAPRPGHADLAGCQKYGVADPRLVLERASARETAARVGLGALARQLLEAFGIELFAHVTALGGEEARADAFEQAGEARTELRARSAFQCLDPEAEGRMRARVERAAAEQDTLGGVFEVRGLGLPPGLGGYAQAQERLSSRLGAALFSIPAIKGVEVGLGFEAAGLSGSAVQDAILPARPPGPFGRFRRETNRAGGLEGGMTNGEPLVLRAAMKPIPTLRRGLPTVDFQTGEETRAAYQRSDITAVPAASVVGEAVVALVLADAFLTKFGGDSLDQVRDGFEAWRRRAGAL